MRRVKFTTIQKLELSKNKCICKVSDCTIVFTAEFKLYAINQHKIGHIPELIFQKAGLPAWVNKKNYARYCVKGWRKAYNERGSFSKKVAKVSGKKCLSKMDKDELTARVAYLEAENDFLKKLKALENI